MKIQKQFGFAQIQTAFFCKNGVLIQEIKTGILRTGKEKAMFEKATYKE